MSKAIFAGLSKMATSRKWIRAVFGLNKSSNFKPSGKDESNKVKSSEKDEPNSGSTNKISHQRKHSNEVKSDIPENQLDSPILFPIDSAKDAGLPSVPNENQLDIDVASDIDSVKDPIFQSVKDFGEFDIGTFEYELDPCGISEFEGGNDASFLSARHSVDVSGGIPENELNQLDAEIEHSPAIDFHSISDPPSWLSNSLAISDIENAKDTSFQSVLDPAWSPSSLLLVRNKFPIQHSMSEECAAIRIQAAFRRFLARRSLRSFRGMIRLHGLTQGHAVKKQVALTLHSMQDLVRVQARTRTRQGRVELENQIACQKVENQMACQKLENQMAYQKLENQIVGQKLQQHVEHEDRDKERKAEWCDRVGSAEEVQARIWKKKEAASRREKAMAYALTRQWQARSRQRVKPVAVVSGQDKVYWSWKWSESWLASSQWESQPSDSDLEDEEKPFVNEPAIAQHKVITRSTSIGKLLIVNTAKSKMIRSSSYKSNASNDGRYSPHCSSPMKSPKLKDPLTPRTPTTPLTPNTPRTPTRSPRHGAKDSFHQSTSRFGLGPRSRGTPKERSPLGDNGKKRLSLPNDNWPQNGVQAAKQSGLPRSNTAPKPKFKNGIDW